MKAPTRRALAKQQTRAKVLAAARRLFSEQGYEGATIRDIAAAAGMSTGAVFANFADKSDLFREIMTTDMLALAEAMTEAAAQGNGVEDSLQKVFAAGYRFYQTQLPLARAAFSVGWSPEDGPALRNAPPVQTMLNLISSQLERGVQGGELADGAASPLRTQMLFDAYLSNYDHAIFQGWAPEALQERSRDQIRILLAGVRRS
ncbi:TetR/AcrR family transcriptional regulator [Phenylobacterium sp.]|uniref:TetR/AcrR family transcriptional regulator n=1 Tax=Phenylobacterium sp. TaxID=1871053 RepID=UPI0025E3FDE3|nr:TetR/AcrR family transcriptional regulator [Phenylobacterium sp.]